MERVVEKLLDVYSLKWVGDYKIIIMCIQRLDSFHTNLNLVEKLWFMEKVVV
jgi:hypothetical protein